MENKDESRSNMEPNKKVLILTGGNVNHDFLLQFLQEEPCEQLICVDGGLLHAYQLGLNVDFIVGDFDTIDKEILRYYKEETEVPIRAFNPVKDSTDTDIALCLALSWNPESIVIIGGIGTRMDHTLGNIHILKKALVKGTKAYLIDEHNRISMLDKPKVMKKENTYGNYISFLPFTEKIENLSLRGFKYPLKNCTMVNGESLGVSNEIIDETAFIEFRKGILLMIESRD